MTGAWWQNAVVEVSATGWALTVGLIGALLVADVGVAARRPHAVGFREAVLWSVFYVAVALLFGVVFGLLAGWDLGAQYFAGYVVEKSLSVDNLFVFLIIMSTFAVPAEHQARALTIGIVAGARAAGRCSSRSARRCWTRSRSCSWCSGWR